MQIRLNIFPQPFLICLPSLMVLSTTHLHLGRRLTFLKLCLDPVVVKPVQRSTVVDICRVYASDLPEGRLNSETGIIS